MEEINISTVVQLLEVVRWQSSCATAFVVMRCGQDECASSLVGRSEHADNAVVSE